MGSFKHLRERRAQKAQLRCQGGVAKVLWAEIAAGRVCTSATHFLGRVGHSLLEGIPKEKVWSSGVPLETGLVIGL